MSSDVQSQDFVVRVEQHENATVVALDGELDITEVPAVINDLHNLVATRRGAIILDVRGLTYIDSSGLAVIASAEAALVQEGRALLAIGCHGIFEKILRVTQLNKVIECFETLEAALERADEHEPHEAADSQ